MASPPLVDTLCQAMAAQPAATRAAATLCFDPTCGIPELAECLQALDRRDLMPNRIFLSRSWVHPALQPYAERIDLSIRHFHAERKLWHDVDAFLFPLSQRWYRYTLPGDNQRVTEYDGMDLGFFLEHTMAAEWLVYYRYLEEIRRYRQSAGGSRPLLFALHSSVWREALEAIPDATLLTAGAPPAAPSDWTTHEPAAILMNLLEAVVDARLPLSNGGTARFRVMDTGHTLEKLPPHCPAVAALGLPGWRLKLSHSWNRLRWITVGKDREFAAASADIQARLNRAAREPEFVRQFQTDAAPNPQWPLQSLGRLEQPLKAALWHAELARQALLHFRIAGSICNNDNFGLQRILTATANRLSIPTVVRQHGMVGLVAGHEYITANAILLWGPQNADIYGVYNAREKLIVTGNYPFDGVPRLQAEPKDQVRARLLASLGLPPARRLYLLATQPLYRNISARFFGDEYEPVIEMFLKAARAKPEARFIIKWHPGEAANPPYLSRIQAAALPNLTTIAKTDLPLLLRAADATIVAGSTTGLEAIVMGTPVIQVEAFPLYRDYREFGAADSVTPGEGLEELLDKIEQDRYVDAARAEGMRRYIERYAHAIDGRNSERIALFLGATFSRPRDPGRSATSP